MKCDCAFCLQLIGHCHTHIFQIVCVRVYVSGRGGGEQCIVHSEAESVAPS